MITVKTKKRSVKKVINGFIIIIIIVTLFSDLGAKESK